MRSVVVIAIEMMSPETGLSHVGIFFWGGRDAYPSGIHQKVSGIHLRHPVPTSELYF